MKYTSVRIRLCAILFFLLPFCSIYAQLQNKNIHITSPTTDITGIAKIIAAQTGWRYSLNMQNGSLRKKITLKPGNYKLSEILAQVKNQAKLSYKIVGNHIIFVDYVTKAHIVSTPVKKYPEKRRAALPAIKKLPEVKHIDTVVTTLPLPIVPDTIQPAPALKDTTPISNTITTTAVNIPDTADKQSAFKMRSVSRDSLYKATEKTVNSADANTMRRERKPILFAKAGFAVDEIFYANSVLEGGFNFLYGIASYGTTFQTGGFRWGGGISFPLNEDNRLHLTFTTGNMRKTYNFDTFPQLLTLKETLHRFGAAWSRQLNNKVSMQIQLHYNLLLKDFTRNETVNKPNPLTGDFDKQYYIIKPPYTLSKSVGETSVTKSWIGIQCTFFYKLW